MSAPRNIWIIFKRELKAQFNSMLAYVFIVIFVVLAMALTFWFRNFFDPGGQDASLEFTFFLWPAWLLMFLAPAVGMRLWSEEHRTGTVELLLTMPMAPWQAIVGKFLAGLAVITLAIICSFPIVITVSYLGDPDNGKVIGGYLATFLYGAACLAITCSVSAFTRSVVACLIISVTICFLMLLLAVPPVQDYFTDLLGGGLSDAISSFSMFSHYNDIKRGVVTLPNIAFFASLIGFCLFLTSIVIKTKRS